MEDVQRAMLC